MEQAARKSGSRLARLAEEQAEEDQERAEEGGQEEAGRGKDGGRTRGGDDGHSDGSGPKVSQGESLPPPPPSSCHWFNSKTVPALVPPSDAASIGTSDNLPG